ncbi:MAG: HesA/MoeB/ThiF family protein [Spirochaetales bacterium]
MGDVSPRTYYDRQLRVPGWGLGGQEVLGKSSVLVVGVGGLGCPALASLARSGVGSLVFCDPDVVEASNLPRQTLFRVTDVGRSKVEAAAEALSGANPWISLKPYPWRVDATNVRALVEAADLVLDGSDNFATKFLLHDACRAAGKPLVMASLYQWEAQLTVFDFRRTDDGCWRCLYPEAPEDGCVGVCADVGVAGALAGLAGNYQALFATRLLLGLEVLAPRTTLVLEASGATRELRWNPAPACACASARGDWAWLAGQGPLREALWDDLVPADRQVVIDLREPHEILVAEWDWFRSQGCEVIASRWTQWPATQPDWQPATSYLVVCAHGIRSLAALAILPTGVRAQSLRGGVAGLPVVALDQP